MASPTKAAAPAWRRQIEDASKRNDSRTRQLMEDIRIQLRSSLPQSVCRNCGREALQLDIVPLPCGHDQCQDCLTSLLTTQTEYFRKTMSPAALDRLGLLRGTVLCSKCQGPFVLQRKTVFDEGFARKMFDPRKLVCLKQLSECLVSPGVCNVCDVYENQRRTMFSRFAGTNLLTTDFRGPWSTENGDMIEDKEQKFKLPNMSCVWLYDWVIDLYRESIDADGWSYCFNWPGTGIGSWSLKWSNSSGAMNFVRRRRHHRVWINFTDEIVAKALQTQVIQLE